MRKAGDTLKENTEGIVFGRNAVLELLKSGAKPDKILLKKGTREGSIKLIEALAIKNGIPVSDAAGEKLDLLSGGGNHQGVVAFCNEKEYSSIDDILEIAKSRGQTPFVVVADGIEDPHNLGAVIRSAECAGAHGVIIPKRRSCTVTPAVAKSSAGALSHIAVSRVSNLASAIDELKEKGLWIYSAEAGGTPYYECDMNRPVCLVLGGENSGVSRLIKDKSDYIVSIPMKGQINSLNVSAAGAVLMFEIARQINKA